jgi:hypothetical protein
MTQGMMQTLVTIDYRSASSYQRSYDKDLPTVSKTEKAESRGVERHP